MTLADDERIPRKNLIVIEIIVRIRPLSDKPTPFPTKAMSFFSISLTFARNPLSFACISAL